MTRTQRVSLFFATALLLLATSLLVSILLQATPATRVLGPVAVVAAGIGMIAGIPRNS